MALPQFRVTGRSGDGEAARVDTSELDGLLDAVPLALILVDRRDRIVLANAGARDLLGGAPEGRSYVATIRQPAALDCIETALRHGRRATARFIRAGMSTETAYRIVAAPVAMPGFDGVMVSFEDISHIEEAETMRRDFIANVSHELRSPLTALTGFIETLRGAARHDAEARERFLAIMEREAQRMNRMVRELLSLSKVEANERVRPRTPVDLPAVIRSAVAALRPMVDASGVALRLELDEESRMVPGDADQLTQLFHNLIENALKYGAPGGAVEIRETLLARHPGFRSPAVRVDVQDWGEGIEPMHIPRLTERFYRVDNHRSREMGGTGLGLAIVKHIVNRHRGRFQIESAPGQGSTFSVILPVEL
jgi:two-component system, OmpR family, phosphate regulon sensor histidine kinase PhoR